MSMTAGVKAALATTHSLCCPSLRITTMGPMPQRQFYVSHGATIAQPAIELSRPSGEIRVMQTRYCIRRELGACLKEKGQVARLPRLLFLRNPSGIYRIDCDCSRCGMDIVKLDK